MAIFRKSLRITSYKLSLHYGTINLDMGGTEVDVNEVIPRPEYDSTTRENDIAIVIPNEDIKISDQAQPVNLPTMDHPSQGGIKTIISRWGVTLVSHYI